MSDPKPWEPIVITPTPTYDEVLCLFSASLGEPTRTVNPDGSVTLTWGSSTVVQDTTYEITRQEAEEQFALKVVNCLKAGGFTEAK